MERCRARSASPPASTRLAPAALPRRHAFRITFAVLLALLSSPAMAGGDAPWTCSSQAIADELMHGAPVEVGRVDAIPAAVLAAMGVDDAKQIANPGEDWNGGCVMDGRPRSTLVFAAHTARLWFVYARFGGYAVDERRGIFCRDGSGEHLYSVRPLPPPPRIDSLPDLQQALTSEPDLIQHGQDW